MSKIITSILNLIKTILVLVVMGTFVCILGAMYMGILLVGYIGVRFKRLKKYLKL